VNTTPDGLRIIHLMAEDCHPDVPNGVVRTALHLASAQACLGHDVRVLRHDALCDQERAVALTRRAKLAGRMRKATCRISRSIRDAVVEARPDFVHLHSIHIPENVGIASALVKAGIPYCITVNGGLSRVARGRSRLRKWAFRTLWEQQYLDAAAFVHAVSPHEQTELHEYGVRVPIVCAPNGVDVRALPGRDTHKGCGPGSQRCRGVESFCSSAVSIRIRRDSTC